MLGGGFFFFVSAFVFGFLASSATGLAATGVGGGAGMRTVGAVGVGAGATAATAGLGGVAGGGAVGRRNGWRDSNYHRFRR